MDKRKHTLIEDKNWCDLYPHELKLQGKIPRKQVV
jgi:hypothetical protein